MVKYAITKIFNCCWDIVRYYRLLYTTFHNFYKSNFECDQILDLCEERHILHAMYHIAKHIMFERDQTMV